MIVFRYLFGHWNDFVQFRSNLADEKILPTIERRRRHAKMKEKQRQKEIEDRAARVREITLPVTSSYPHVEILIFLC